MTEKLLSVVLRIINKQNKIENISLSSKLTLHYLDYILKNSKVFISLIILVLKNLKSVQSNNINYGIIVSS